MPTPRWRKDISVTRDLVQSPYKYSFSQTVRLLQRSAMLNKGRSIQAIGRFTPPTTEAIRFSTNQSLSFPGAEIESISNSTSGVRKDRWDVNVNFMGLTGSMGILPYHYTELIQKRVKIKDNSLRDFFDLFNHRTISLFYQASTKYRLAINYERHKINKETMPDDFTQALLSLIGLGSPHLRNRLYTNDESLIYYSGLLSEQIKTSSGLKQILEEHFKVPIKIREFIGQWQELIDDVRSRLPQGKSSSGQNNRLGKSAMLGRKGWLAQGKFSVIIGPLNSTQLEDFSPGTKALKAMNEIVRLYAGMEYDYDFKIQIKKRDLPNRIKMDRKKPLCMGWNTWLAGKENKDIANNEIMEISISAGRLM